MPLPNPKLIDLAQAFNRIGTTFCDGWTGEELSASRLGQQSKIDRAVWDRAQRALRKMRELARDGHLGIIMYDGKGRRKRYFEDPDGYELTGIYPCPVDDEPGMVEFADGSMWPCEADISQLTLRAAPRKKPGPRPKFTALIQLCADYFAAHSPAKHIDDVKIYLNAHMGDAPWPRSHTTINRYIEEARDAARETVQRSNADATVADPL